MGFSKDASRGLESFSLDDLGFFQTPLSDIGDGLSIHELDRRRVRFPESSSTDLEAI